MQSLLGKLLYITKCVRYSRIFMGRMLQLFRSFHHKQSIILSEEFKKRFVLVLYFLANVQWQSIYSACVANHSIYVDASFHGCWGIL